MMIMGDSAMYCDKCGICFGANYCPKCGNTNVCTPQPNDMCFLAEKELLWSEMLEDVLRQNNIPFLTKKALGIGMALKVGPMRESVRICVPYSYLQGAKMIVESLFSIPKDDNCDEN